MQRFPANTDKNKSILMEALIIILLLTGFNLHLIFGPFFNAMVYYPEGGGTFPWLRLLAHPFVHMSRYHFLLDAGAFLLLYFELNVARIEKLVHIIISATASFFLVNTIATSSISAGFCGLSGIAHGLMAVWGLELLFSKATRPVALLTLAIIIVKCGIETFTGTALFSWMHMGQCGSPVPAAHAGGVLGGLFSSVLFHAKKSWYADRQIFILQRLSQGNAYEKIR